MKNKRYVQNKRRIKALAAKGLSVTVAAATLVSMAVPAYADENTAVYQEVSQETEEYDKEGGGITDNAVNSGGTVNEENGAAADGSETGENETDGNETDDTVTAGDKTEEEITEELETVETEPEVIETEDEKADIPTDGVNAQNELPETNSVSGVQQNEIKTVNEPVEVASPLMITEIVADTHRADQTTASGTDAFEYVEIRNVSDSAVSLDNYLIQNVNGGTVTDWDIPAGTTLEAGKTLIVWIRNAESGGLDDSAFRTYYSADDSVNIVKTVENVNGFSNSGERSIRIIVKSTKQTITQITYNDGEQKAQTKKGITFGYNAGQIQQRTLSYDGDPTPGSLSDGQNEGWYYRVEEQADAYVSVTADTEANPGTSFEISAETNLTGVVTEAYVSVSGSGNKQYAMSYADGVYTASIPSADFETLDSFKYTVHMSDGVNSPASAENTVTVNKQGEKPEFPAPILITELVPNTANVDGSDAFEYFEIYNASEKTVSLGDYAFWYDNGKSVTEWELADKEMTVEPGKSVVVWVKNDAVAAARYTAADFNAEYGTSFTEGRDLTSVMSDGLSNSGTRSIQVRTRTGLELYTVTYDAADSSNGKIDEGEAIAINYSGADISVNFDKSATPGLADTDGGQTLYGQFTFPAAVDAPEAAVSAPSDIAEGESWTVKVDSTNLNSEKILNAKLKIYADGSQEVSAQRELVYEDGSLQATLDYTDVSEMKSFSYEVELSDGVNKAVSGRQEVTVAGSVQQESSAAPALVITELIPDTTNVNGADGYEFIELYNNSNRDIDLKDYKLYYNYPDNGDDSDVVWWETSESRIIKAGDTLVFWIKNGGNDALTVDDFNGQFGTNLDSDHLIEISNGGMSNSGARGVKIASNVKDIVDYVTYNMGGADNTNKDLAITYQNQLSGETFSSVMTGDSAEPTPGQITAAEKPQYRAVLPESAEAPVYEDLTPEQFNTDSSLTFAIDAVSESSSIKTVKLYIKDDKSNDFEEYNLLRSTEDNMSSVFSKEVPTVDLMGKNSFEYYFVISDGYNTVETDHKMVQNENPVQEGDSLNVSDGEFISGTTAIIGTGSDLKIDGEDVMDKTVPSINGDAKIAFDTSQTDVFFKNAVAIGDDVLGVFNEGTYSEWATYAYDVDEHYFDSETREITIAFHAGNKANALEHDIENNDDFVVKNIRLVLPDGTTLRPEKYEAVNGIGAIEHTQENWKPDEPHALDGIGLETEISMGDGTTKVEILYVTFRLDESSFNAMRYDLDTTALSDGEHNISSGECSVNVIVDNTAPEITTNIEEGKTYRSVTVEAEAKDALSSNVTLEALLDDEVIALPYELSNKEVEAGEHTLILNAQDEVGNTSQKEISFYVPEENAEVEGDILPADGSEVIGDPTFAVKVNDPTGDDMTVSFKRGDRYELGDENIVQSEGVSDTSGINGSAFTEDSGDGFPWQEFDITVGENVSEDASVRVEWEGVSNNAKTFLYVYNTSTGSWEKTDAEQSSDAGNMTLSADIALKDHVSGSVVKVMIQNGEGYTPTQYAPGEASAEANSNPSDTPRSSYDFTFAVESDTQYYNEDYEGNPDKDEDGLYKYQLDIHNWIINNRSRMNIQYMFHDGDIIDDEPNIPEWENADAAYKMLDEAGLPYGVLAGNHDVGHLSGDYSNYCKYFGEWRYSSNPWYGGSYADNRGHYDLITVDGIDFIMIYMGWGVGDEEIDWMNDVLAQYPERKAILNFHEYLLASGGFGEEPQRIYNEVVATNPNVCMVLSGHYHNAQTRVDSFDDDGDGVAERNVYQMLFDYQGLKEGGMGYMRLMHFDLDGQQVIIRTYSPALDDYNAKDETNIGDVGAITEGAEEFTISFAELGIVPEVKQLETTGLKVSVYGDETIGSVKNVPSGSTAKYTWTGAPEGTVGWYAEITDENGGLTRTDVNYVTIVKTGFEPVITLPGTEANTLKVGDEFDPMANVTAVDYQGNDITDRVTVEGTVDTSRAGSYELTYLVTDEAGNTAQAVRVIQVMSEGGSETPAPTPGGDETPAPTPGGDDTTTPAPTPGGDDTTTPAPTPGTDDGGDGGEDSDGGNSVNTPDGNKETGSGGKKTDAPDTSDIAGAQTPVYAAGLMGAAAGIAVLLKKKLSFKNRKKK